MKRLRLSRTTALVLPVLLAASSALHGAILVTEAFLDGPSEAPPNASPGTGFARVTYDSIAQTLEVEANFNGLLGNVTAAHIHGPQPNPVTGTAGVMTTTPTFPGFPAGVTAGTYRSTFDLTLASSWNPAFLSNNSLTTAQAEAVLAAALQAGTTYFNIHSSVVPGGEIRGFLVPVPEPGVTGLVAGLGLCALGAWRRFHRA